MPEICTPLKEMMGNKLLKYRRFAVQNIVVDGAIAVWEKLVRDVVSGA